MIAMKRMFVVMLMVTFTMNVIASAAYAACNCADMTSESMQQMENSDMPCHDMDKAEADQSNNLDEQDTAQCTDCGCDNCKAPSQTSIIDSPSSSDKIAASMTNMSHSKVVLSKVIFGIDNPPKYIS